MKKLLLGTTAIAALGLVAGPAAAAEKIKLGLGGFMNQWVGFANNEDSFNNTNAQTARRQDSYFDTQSDTEVHFKGSTKLDNGITVSAKIELEGDTRNGAVIDESVVMLKSDSLGQLWIGSEDMATYTVHHAAPDVGIGIEQGDFANWVVQPGALVAGTFTSFDPGDDSNKVSYFSPRFAGFGVVGSYAPDVATNAGAGNPLATGADDAWTVGVVYEGEFSGVSIGADIGYGAQNGDDGVVGVNPTGFDELFGGLSIGYGGFTVGGGYLTRDQAKTPGTVSTDGDTWSLGVSYETGPFGVSLGYMASKREGTVANPADDELTLIQASGSYNLGPGVTLAGSVLKADYDDETTAAANNNEGWAVVAGFVLEF
ncbi:MAG: porin [Rhodobacterales bacterium]|nr:porin [Rhodobacterales bacterium]